MRGQPLFIQVNHTNPHTLLSLIPKSDVSCRKAAQACDAGISPSPSRTSQNIILVRVFGMEVFAQTTESYPSASVRGASRWLANAATITRASIQGNLPAGDSQPAHGTHRRGATSDGHEGSILVQCYGMSRIVWLP